MISPMDFINKPYIPCPFCGKHSFGVLMVRSDSYLRRCTECFRPRGDENAAAYPLPILEKKVIYIDQMGISNMMKALNPNIRAGGSGKASEFWLQLFDRLDVLAKLQLCVYPESSFHEWESLVAPFFRPLNRMYEHLSCGVSFLDPDTIARFQIIGQLHLWLGKKDRSILDIHRVVNGRINAWLERLQVSVHLGHSPELLEELRRDREITARWVNNVFKRWQGEKGRSFLDWYEEERRASAKVLVERYQMQKAKALSMGLGLRPLNPLGLIPDMATLTIYEIRDVLTREGTPVDQVDQRVNEFLKSDAYKEASHIRIASMLYAAMAREAAGGRKKSPGRGFYTDVRIVSTLLPYCDAMFVDNEFRGLLSKQPLCDELLDQTQVFSFATGEEFLRYLDEIKASASGAHLKAVEEVYGPDWATPYRELYGERLANS